MNSPKIGAAPPPSASPASRSIQGGPQLRGLEQYQGTVEDVAQHLAADQSLRTPGQLHQGAQSALNELTGLKGLPLQQLVMQTLQRVDDIRLSSKDRWLSGHGPSDSFTIGGGSTIRGGMPSL